MELPEERHKRIEGYILNNARGIEANLDLFKKLTNTIENLLKRVEFLEKEIKKAAGDDPF